ncbi:Stimulator of FtsZ polymerization and component of cell-division Z-ring [Apilactobacillus kunkeei]|uniref:cell division protein ZapA n=1 Tax=Apilactobacillus kunkeei TaxID=148814 RepID=UPI0006C4A6A4|nr:cell division protein ZapA [Apilactobacillus kunkeei]KOY75312.1 Stimulator of FtsZ polymerization and component of cell-division Z-ring [Apilactobacillus kunkeei]
MNDTNQRFKASIGKKNYTFVGNSSADHMKTVTELMNRQLVQLKEMSPDINDEDAAILLAFNAFSEQIKLQEKLNELTENNEEEGNMN